MMAGHDAGRAGATGRSKWLVAAYWVALAMFPLCLVTAGATVFGSLVALAGVIAVIGGSRLPQELRQVHWFFLSCYLVLLLVDLVNGGGLANLTSTGINYLHLLAVAPLAHALNLIGVTWRTLERALWLTVWLAVANSTVQYFGFEIERPGGLQLNPVPYGLVVAVWGTFILARSLDRDTTRWPGLVTALAAFVPVVLTESKIVMVVLVAGYLVVILGMAWKRRSGALVLRSAAIGLPVLLVAYFSLAHRRIEDLVVEIQNYLQFGVLTNDSFGPRWELLRLSMLAIEDKPWLGHGIVDRKMAAFAYAEPDGPNVMSLGHLHNDYVTHAVAFGVPGVIFILAFLGFIIHAGRRAPTHALQISGYALALMMALYMTTEVAFNMDPVSGCLTIALGILLARRVAQLPATAAG